MKNTRALCQTAVVAALYVALTTLNPLSWGAIQFRVANMLCALPFKDKRYAPAVLLGIAIANATSPFGPVDVAFGLMAEGAAYLLVVWGPWKKLGILWKAVILSLSVALFIGVELYAMVGAPFLLTAAGLFVGTFLAVELGNMMVRPNFCIFLLNSLECSGWKSGIGNIGYASGKTALSAGKSENRMRIPAEQFGALFRVRWGIAQAPIQARSHSGTYRMKLYGCWNRKIA